MNNRPNSTETDNDTLSFCDFLRSIDRTIHDDNQRDETANFSLLVDGDMSPASGD